MGTAVVIQEMVFGNFNENQEQEFYLQEILLQEKIKIFGEVLLNAQGEDIVAGIRTPDNIELLQNSMPDIYNQLVETAKKLEKT